MSYPVTIEYEGRTLSGSYVVFEGIVTVSTGVGFKSARISGGDGTDAERLARVLLVELARDGKA